MLLVLLSLLTLSLFCLAYFLFNKDFFSPSVLFCLSYFVATLCCIYNANAWGVDLDSRTMFLIIISLISFILGEALVRKTIRPKNKSGSIIQPTFIKISHFKLMLVLGLNIVLTVLLYEEIVRIANLNFSSWGNLIYNFKTNSNSLEGAEVSGVVTQGLKVSKALGYVFLYVFINNLFSSKEKKYKNQNILYLLPIAFVVIQSLLKGVRIAVITIVFAAVFLTYIFMLIRKNWNWNIRMKHIITTGVIMILICTLFYQSKDIVGRLQDDMGTIKYVTTYLGGNIELFNLYIKYGINESGNVVETMGGAVSSLQKVGLFQDVITNQVREYRNTTTGITIGNVYGAIRDYYHDFGFIGVPICFFLLSIFVNILYCNILKRKGDNLKSPILLIIYSTFVYAIYFLTFADFITAKLAIGVLIEFLFIGLSAKFLMKTNYGKIK